MPLEMKLSPSDFIALAAFLVAVLSAIYARGARNAAEHANVISTRESRRPLRLHVFQTMHRFSDYCTRYWTLYHMKEVTRSRQLTDAIATFKWEIEQQGHLDMPDVEEKAKEFVQNAWKMQRLLDRFDVKQKNPLDRQPPTAEAAEEEIEALVDWFAKENGELKGLFEPYLSAP